LIFKETSMKKCAICNTEYDLRIEYCFRDGSPLEDALKGPAPKLVPNQLSNISDPVDMMQTLDNISIDDLLQIGGSGGFQGFGEFSPIEAPASKDGDTLSMSRSSIQDMLTEGGNPPSIPEQIISSVNQTGEAELEDVEDILGSFGRDVGAHLDETLDGIQIGQLMEDATLDMMGTNEILPGDTLDILVNDFDVPEMQEADLEKVEQGFSDDLDQWEASGPIMQEAARQALEQHSKHSGGAVNSASTSNNDINSSRQPESKGSNKLPLVVGALVLLIGGGVLLFGGGSTESVEPSSEDTTLTGNPRLVAPPVKTLKGNTTSVTGSKEANDKNDLEGNDSNKVLDNGSIPSQGSPGVINTVDTLKGVGNIDTTSTEPKENSTDTNDVNSITPDVQTPTKVPSSTKSQSTATKPTVQSPPKKTSAPKKKKPAPKKPKSKPKPMPKKDPAVDNGWAPVQSGGWGVSTCGVQVSSNVSSAEVFLDGVRKGAVGKNLTVDCGKHKLEIRADGYKSNSRSIDLTGDASFTIDLSK
jgi:hypothetical protein